MDAAGAEHAPVGGGGMETSETISGERERAPVGGVMDSDISNRLSGKKCRVGDFHLASVAVKAVVAARAQWRAIAPPLTWKTSQIYA